MWRGYLRRAGTHTTTHVPPLTKVTAEVAEISNVLLTRAAADRRSSRKPRCSEQVGPVVLRFTAEDFIAMAADQGACGHTGPEAQPPRAGAAVANPSRLRHARDDLAEGRCRVETGAAGAPVVAVSALGAIQLAQAVSVHAVVSGPTGDGVVAARPGRRAEDR